jgi:hypothetical protein
MNYLFLTKHTGKRLFSHILYIELVIKLLVSGDAKVWHWRMPQGGIRSDNNEYDYHHDEGIFRSILSIWGVSEEDRKNDSTGLWYWRPIGLSRTFFLN